MRTKSRPLYHKMIIQSIPKEILQCHQSRQKMLPNCKRNIQYELLCLDFSIPNTTLNQLFLSVQLHRFYRKSVQINKNIIQINIKICYRNFRMGTVLQKIYVDYSETSGTLFGPSIRKKSVLPKNQQQGLSSIFVYHLLTKGCVINTHIETYAAKMRLELWFTMCILFNEHLLNIIFQKLD